MARQPYIEIQGLKPFRRDLKQLQPQLQRELKARLREIAQNVAGKSSALAPRRTGTLAGSYRGTATQGLRAQVVNRQFYGRFIEFGFHPRGSSTFVQGRNVIGRVLERDEDRIVDEIGDAIEDVARKAGWR